MELKNKILTILVFIIIFLVFEFLISSNIALSYWEYFILIISIS
jgi:hypothetical protein